MHEFDQILRVCVVKIERERERVKENGRLRQSLEVSF